MVANFTAWKFPFKRGSVVPPPLADQQSPVAALNHRRYYGDHLSSCLCASRFRGCNARHNSRAPLTKGGPGVFRSSSLMTYTCRFRMAGTSFQARSEERRVGTASEER